MRLLLFIPGLLFISSICLSGCDGPSQSSEEVTGVVYYFDQPKVVSTQNSELHVGKVGKPIAGAKVTFHGQGVPIGYGITDGLVDFASKRIIMCPNRLMGCRWGYTPSPLPS